MRCEADCAGSALWVKETLAQIAAAPGGAELVAAFWRPPYRLRPWLAWHWLTDRLSGRAWQPGRITERLTVPAEKLALNARPLAVVFTTRFPWLSSFGRLAMVTRPWAIYVQTSIFAPDKAPSPAAVLVFAHELVHVQQGPLLAASIMGELLAYYRQSQLRPYLAPGYAASAGEQDAVAVAERIDLVNWRQLRGAARQLLKEELRWWRNRHPAYRYVPLLPLL
jgi:hypothetical protein